uniref:BTB domain-containing protein n=1 Tax=Panagrolaimus davidi TaxID=227884 RepID=A0A914QF21_9BILA
MDSAVTQKLKCPIAIKLTIPEDKLEEQKEGSEDCLYSDDYEAFNIPGVEYGISLYPNYDHVGESRFIFFVSLSNPIKIDANIKIEIKSANYIFEKNFVVFEGDYTEYEKLCTTEELFDTEKCFIVDGKMIIKIDGFFTIEKEAEDDTLLQCDNFDISLCLALWKQETKDFVIAAEGKEIVVHKWVLALRSPIFARMFESGMKEAEENKVIITDFSFIVVEKAIKLCYHQSLVPHSTLEEKMKFLQFFNKYDIQPLKNNLETYLITVLNELTVCRLTNAALLSNATKLETKCTEFLKDSIKKKPISDFDILDKDFALNLFKGTFCHMSEA